VSSSGSGQLGRWFARLAVIIIGGAATLLSGGLLAAHSVLLYAATEAAMGEDSLGGSRARRTRIPRR